MSGVAGGNRIEKADVKKTFDSFVSNVLTKIPGYKQAVLSGSVKVGVKPDYGDLDLVTWFEGTDKKEVKQRIINFVSTLPDNVILPFKSEKYKGKKYYNSGEIISVLYPIVNKPGQSIQVDCVISISQEEHTFKSEFLDLPAEKQGLIIGLAKVILLEESPKSIFKRLNIPLINLEPDEEFEFNLSSVKLTLRKVKLENFKEISREDIWETSDWNVVKKLFQNFKIDGSFDELLDDLSSKLKNPRSKNRVAGIFRSMVSVKSGEVGTPKGAGKEQAILKVNQKLTESLNSTLGTVAIYAGGFKPPHKAHFENAKILSQTADKLIIFIGPKIREGVTVTPQQSKKIWEIYAKYLPIPVEVQISAITPIKDTYDWIDANINNVQQIITGTTAEEMKKFSSIEKNKEKYSKVKIVTLPVITTNEDDKFSASHIRSSNEYLKQGDWLPKELSQDDFYNIIGILTNNVNESINLKSFKEFFKSRF